MESLVAQVGNSIARLKAEQELRESEIKFAQLVEQSPISIEIYTPRGCWPVPIKRMRTFGILREKRWLVHTIFSRTNTRKT